MSLHPRAEKAVQAYLDAIDVVAPDVVAELYVDGSAVLGDFQPGTSDIDFVAVTNRGIGHASWAAIEEAHRLLLASDPSCRLDGVYVDANELASETAITSGHCVHAGAYAESGRHGREALRWHALAGSGEVVRGDTILPSVPAWVRAQKLEQAVLESAERFPHAREVVRRERHEQALVSQVLDVTRLHYASTTSRFCSKWKAGLYGLVTFQGWGRLIESALRLRRDPLVQGTRSSETEATEFIEFVLADLRDLASGN